MIIFDASYMVVFLNRDPEPAADRQGKPVSRFKDRVEYLAASLNASGEQIGIPTPAMAEVLVRAGRGRSQFVSILSDRMRFQLIPFDARAAIEAAELIALIKSKSETWGTHAKVKFDIQIVATAKAEDATIIYSDDQDIENFAKRFKIPVMRICDLPLPPPKEFPKIDSGPIGAQTTLFEMGHSLFHPRPIIAPDQSTQTVGGPDESESTRNASGPSPESGNERETDPAHPTLVRGSEAGHPEGKAAGEATFQATSGEVPEEPKSRQ